MAQANETSNMFEPEIFQAMVDAMEPARGLMLYNQVRKDSTPFPYVQWTINRGRFSELAEFNAPNAKANIVDPHPERKSSGNAALAYIREGEYFTPTATLLLKDVASGNKAAIASAEQKVSEEVAHVNDRINNRIEWSLWKALQGGFSYSGNNTGDLVVDYGFRATHKATAATVDQWDNDPSVDSLISTVRGMNQLIQKDGGVPVTDVFLTRATFDLLISAWTNAALATDNRSLLTDAQINQYYQTGEISGFMGVDRWKTVEQYYDVINPDGSATVNPYIPHGTLIYGNLTANNPLRYTSGPSVDFDAPRGHIGRFAKNWTNPDPSGRAFLIEEYGLPVLDRPDQFATLKVASDTWIGQQGWNN